MVAVPLHNVPEPASAREALQRSVIAGLIGGQLSSEETQARYEISVKQLKDDFFAGPLFNTWKIVTRYISLAGIPPTPSDFDEYMGAIANITFDAKIAACQLYAQLYEEALPRARYRMSAIRLADRWRNETYAESLSIAQRIHTAAAVIEGKSVSGLEDSMTYLRSAVDKLELDTSDHSEGDLSDELGEVLSAYQRAKAGNIEGVPTGFDELDNLTNGLQRGELWLIPGFTGEGKSKVCYNIAYNAAYIHGRNVLFCTAEATREQVRRNIVVRHTHHPKFDKRGGIRYSDLKFGSLSPTDEEIMRNVLLDIKQTPDYGRLHIVNVPHRASMDFIREVFMRQIKLHHVDLVVIDYLGLMSSSTRRASRREELDDLIVAAKRFATDAYEGRGVPVLSPWQIARESWKEAQKSGKYTKASLSDTSQAERSADLIAAIMRKEDAPAELSMTVLKARDAEEDITFSLAIDYATSLVSSDREMTNLLA